MPGPRLRGGKLLCRATRLGGHRLPLSEMAGHQGVYARLRRAMPGHDEASGVRLTLRIDDLLEPAQYPHAGKQLGEAAVRLALLLDRRDELAVLQLDAVHRNVDLGDVDRLVLAVE